MQFSLNIVAAVSRVVRVASVVLLFCGVTTAAAAESDREFALRFVREACVRCHGPQRTEGDLQLHALTGDAAGAEVDAWFAVAERLVLGEMPPAGEPRPSPHASGRLVAWLKIELAKSGRDLTDAERRVSLPQHGNRVDHEALFAAGAKSLAASPARLWRKSPQIYSAWASKIMNGRTGVSQPFTASSAEGIKDYAVLFTIDEPTVAQLMRNAQAIVDLQLTGSGGIREFAPIARSAEPVSVEAQETALRKEFQLVLLRDPTADELGRFLKLWEKNTTDAGRDIGARATLAAVFLLPEALYRLELGGEPDEHGRRMLAPRELASAVGYALSDAGPDAALLKAAADGRLQSRDDIERQIGRLLAEPKFVASRIPRFFEEYFEYPAAYEVFKDLERGQWRPEVLVNDTRELIDHVLADDRNVLYRLLTTDESYVNYKYDRNKGTSGPAFIANKNGNKPSDKKPPPRRQLEYHDLYNLPEDWNWTAEQPLRLPRGERAGVLTQPSWLAAFATNNENHAIRRGKWIRERLLGGAVPDLPITVDAQLPDAPDKTLRERMEITKQEYCWQCHRLMNPLGLAFESFDYLGRRRTTERVVDVSVPPQVVDKNKPPQLTYRDLPLDSTGYVEGSGDPALDGPVTDGVELIHRLAGSVRVRQVFVRHAFRYWLGRNETLDDAATLAAADEAYARSGGSMQALVTSLLTSDSFLYRRR